MLVEPGILDSRHRVRRRLACDHQPGTFAGRAPGEAATRRALIDIARRLDPDRAARWAVRRRGRAGARLGPQVTAPSGHGTNFCWP